MVGTLRPKNLVEFESLGAPIYHKKKHNLLAQPHECSASNEALIVFPVNITSSIKTTSPSSTQQGDPVTRAKRVPTLARSSI